MTTTDAAVVMPEPHGSGVSVVDNLHELTVDLSHSAYHNADMAPTTRDQRTWSVRDMAALWIGMSACIPSYMLASSLIASGMNWWQATLTVFLGNCIVLVPMVLNAHAGTKYGIPFPVYCRASFGVLGANFPAMLRALVACGWFGIQTWIGGLGLYVPLLVFFPGLATAPEVIAGISLPQLACFLAFWGINMWVIYRGIESIRMLMNLATPILIGVPVALLIWAYVEAGGLGPIFNQPSAFAPGGDKEGRFLLFFFPALTGMIGFWSTLSLNIPDFSRFARSQKDQVLGQFLGLPTTMGLYAFIGVAVTSATFVIYGEYLWNPLDLLARFENPVVVVVSMLALAAATLSTNIAANVVGPANDFSHLWPRRISFRTGGFITGVIGILMQPWKLVEDPTGYIFNWLIAYSALLGAIGGILIADYFIIRRTRLDLPGLYRKEGPYWYKRGINPIAVIAFLAGVAPCGPGFLGTVTRWQAPEVFMQMYHYAWFISFTVAMIVYIALMQLTRHSAATASHKPG
jgi:NCS1 family nucleobase:cation symporter-1